MSDATPTITLLSATTGARRHALFVGGVLDGRVRLASLSEDRVYSALPYAAEVDFWEQGWALQTSPYGGFDVYRRSMYVWDGAWIYQSQSRTVDFGLPVYVLCSVVSPKDVDALFIGALIKATPKRLVSRVRAARAGRATRRWPWES